MSKAKLIQGMTVFSVKGSFPIQEDHLLMEPENGIFLIADGFGGAEPGLEAARITCESVRNFLRKEAGDDDATMPFQLRTYFSLSANVLFNALMYANDQVNRFNAGRSANEKGGASVVAAYFDGRALSIANVGSCSGWIFRGERAERLVLPKTYQRYIDVTRPVEIGQYDIPLMSVGTSADLEPEINEHTVIPGDWLLIHSDGFPTELVDEVLTLKRMGFEAGEAATKTSELLQSIKFNDNASISLIVF